MTHHQAFEQLQTGANTQVHAVQHGYKSDPHCLYCGYEHHRRGQSCPARDTTCRRCGQKGHWGKSRICPKRRQASSNSSVKIHRNHVVDRSHEVEEEAVGEVVEVTPSVGTDRWARSHATTTNKHEMSLSSKWTMILSQYKMWISARQHTRQWI